MSHDPSTHVHGDHAPTHEEHADHSDHSDHSGHGGHGEHGGHGDHVAQFRRLFWIMLVLAIPVVAVSPMFAHLLGYSVPESGGVSWIPPVLGTVLYVWGGRPFLTGGVSEVRSRQPGMMLLIALAITVAFLASWGSTLGLLDPQLDFWWELALLVVIMLLGHWVEMRSLAQTSSALDSLAALLPDEAERVEGEEIVIVDPSELAVGDTVVVRPGASVPADGTIVDGAASMDESMITGESTTVRREVGDGVVAGTVATDSGLRLEVSATGEDTALAGIRKLVSDAQSSSSRAQRLADTAAGWLVASAVRSVIARSIASRTVNLRSWSSGVSLLARMCSRSVSRQTRRQTASYRASAPLSTTVSPKARAQPSSSARRRRRADRRAGKLRFIQKHPFHPSVWVKRGRGKQAEAARPPVFQAFLAVRRGALGTTRAPPRSGRAR